MKLIIDIPEEDYIRLRDEGMFGNVTTFKRAVREGIPLEQEPCEMTAEEYRQRMMQAFHNADCDELIALVVLPTEKEFEHLEWLLEKHYKAKPEPCEDAISRQAVLDLAKFDGRKNLGSIIHAFDVEQLPPVTPQYTDAEIQKMQDLEFAEIQKAYEIGKEEGSSEKPNKWIPVSERLPEIHNYMQEYIVTIKGNFIRTAFFTETNGKSWWSIDNVIAWMPLPLPWKAESEDKE